MKRWIPFMTPDPVVAVIRLHGQISTGTRGQLNDVAMAPAIERAFRKGSPKAVALSINSPGGSPVQSSLIAARIKRLSEEKEIPVFAFVEDAAASGGYWLACAADTIYVDRSSIVGSIGVIMASFGFADFIGKHGVERRVYTSGESKSQLDPFKPEDPKDVEHIKEIGGDIHDAFIEHVKAARGDRLSDDPKLFSGQFWTGTKGIELGLADEIGHLVPVMKEKFGKDTKFAVYGPKKSLFRRFGAQIAEDALTTLDERTAWSRFGL
ncbi:S49 family peptidase [Maritimibacter dapengensis]|uniref:S49 family peptidase n=1 Tax=Maritimibacter dapengensis TaxID=2836868 RepID=A0ABS6SWL2_9RHOB|nr:S49 family peptidase [Maritimibacter dapengensis]MBV7377344.1 S49 family peptidase [Maritimibacter dapengensis]